MRRLVVATAALAAGVLGGSCFVAVPDVACPEATSSCREERWCRTLSPAPLFCADFDEGPLEAGWNDQLVTSGGAIAPDATLFESPPSSFWATSPPLDTGFAHARLCKSFAAFPSEMHLNLSVRAAEPSGPYSAVIASLRLEAEGTFYIDIVGSPDGWRLEQEWVGFDGASETWPPSPFDASAAAAEWTRLALDVTLSPDGERTSGLIDVHLNGDPTMPTQPLSAPITAGTASMCLGVVFAEAPNDTWEVHVDNATFDMLPPP